MGELELLLREIKDKWTRENFFRVLNYIDQEVILKGDWALHEIRFDAANTEFKLAHNRDFIPYDIIVLQVVGDRNVEFNHDKFDFKNINITVKGPCYVRFLAGRFRDKRLSDAARQGLTNVSVGSVPGTTGPLAQVCQTMTCLASVAVNDWVYQSASAVNTAVKEVNDTNAEPTLGIVKSKPTSTTAEVLILGLYSGLSISGKGRFWLSSTGTATFTPAASGTGRIIRALGVAFDNGTIFVNPEKVGIELDDG